MTITHKWQFAPRFRRQAFGWRSDTPIRRIKEALSEIKLAARKDPVLAAQGALSFLEKLSPALEQVDSSSGAIGSAVNKAIEALVPIIAKADVDSKTRQKWLERLWKALEEDEIPYVESLADFFGDLCATPEVASAWADEFKPTVERVWSPNADGYGFYKGTSACLSCLHAAGRYEELLTLLKSPRSSFWHYQQWGVKALVSLGRKEEALGYAENSREFSHYDRQIAQANEEILLSMGKTQEAYERYAIEANQGMTNLATFRGIAKKYPDIPTEEILRDLIASTPGAEGKWFAAAKDAGFFEIAIELVKTSPADPRTLTRAARDYADSQPIFALESATAALHWIAAGYGYEITALEVFEAHDAMVKAASNAGLTPAQITESTQNLFDERLPNGKFLRELLGKSTSDFGKFKVGDR